MVKTPLEGKTIQLGYTSSTTTDPETSSLDIEEMMTPDQNEYAEKLGYD